MIRQTIELLFDENRDESVMLDAIFNALWSLAQGFQVSSEEMAQIIFETQERKQIERGVVAARLMRLVRYLREGRPFQNTETEAPPF